MGMEKIIYQKNLKEILNPCIDPVFKSIFTKDTPESKQALRGLVSAVLQKDLTVVSVTANEPPVNNAAGKQIRYDINCVLDNGEKANVEMTLWPKAHEVYKMEYYLARLHTSQEIQGVKSGYKKLKQSYQISLFSKANVFSDEHFFHHFFYHDPVRNVNLGGRTAIYTVELGKLLEILKKAVHEMTRLERWAVFFAYFNDPDPEKQAIIRQIVSMEEEIQMAEKMMYRITPAEEAALRQISEDKYWTDLADARYDLHLKKKRFKRYKARVLQDLKAMKEDIRTEIEQSLKQSLEKSLEQGIEKGREEIIKLLEQGLSVDEIKQRTGA